MNAVVVYESVYGNTRAVAEAIAEGLGGAEVVPVSKADPIPTADLLVVGGPTHMNGLASSRGRHVAVDAAKEDGTLSSSPACIRRSGWDRELGHAIIR
jgi:flavorubredoxin